MTPEGQISLYRLTQPQSENPFLTGPVFQKQMSWMAPAPIGVAMRHKFGISWRFLQSTTPIRNANTDVDGPVWHVLASVLRKEQRN